MNLTTMKQAVSERAQRLVAQRARDDVPVRVWRREDCRMVEADMTGMWSCGGAVWCRMLVGGSEVLARYNFAGDLIISERTGLDLTERELEAIDAAAMAILGLES